MNLEVQEADREERMDMAGIRRVFRQEQPEPARSTGKKRREVVKFFLDIRGERRYSPRFIPGGLAPGG